MISTDRLILRRPRLEDFEPYRQMWLDPEILRHIAPGPFSDEQMWTRFLRQEGGWQFFGFGYFVIEEKSSGHFVGQMGFQELRREISPPLTGTLETGWTIAPAAQGRGYASEAALAAFGWAREHHAGRRVTAIVSPANVASIRIVEKLGMQLFAQTEYHGKPVTLFDHIL